MVEDIRSSDGNLFLGKSRVTNIRSEGGVGRFEFDGKEYLVSAGNDKGNITDAERACISDGYTLAALHYINEFHGCDTISIAPCNKSTDFWLLHK